jgi:hypothetical protein
MEKFSAIWRNNDSMVCVGLDPDKGKLIADLLDGIPYAENVEIANREREFTFEYKGKKYKVVLSCPRT